MSIGERVRQARKDSNLTQAQLAARTGIKQPTISDLENGESNGTVHIAKLAAELRVSALWLETGKGEKRKAERPFDVENIDPQSYAQKRFQEENELLDLFRNTDDAGRQQILRTAQAMPRPGKRTTRVIDSNR